MVAGSVNLGVGVRVDVVWMLRRVVLEVPGTRCHVIVLHFMMTFRVT
jgi:hypothetical protein